MAKKRIDDELITNVALLRVRILETNKRMLKLYKQQLEDVELLNKIMTDHKLEHKMEEWYLDVVKFMSSAGIEGSNDRFKTT